MQGGTGDICVLAMNTEYQGLQPLCIILVHISQNQASEIDSTSVEQMPTQKWETGLKVQSINLLFTCPVKNRSYQHIFEPHQYSLRKIWVRGVRKSLLTLSDDKYGVWTHLTLFKETKEEKTNTSLWGKNTGQRKRKQHIRDQEKRVNI